MDWQPVFYLPNIILNATIEGHGIALAGRSDQRVALLEQHHPNFSEFLNRFSDQFGLLYRPTVLLVHNDFSNKVANADALSGFRDALAASTIPFARSRSTNTDRAGGCAWANTLQFYPWTPDSNLKWLRLRTLAASGIHEVQQFSGQTSPEVFHLTLDVSHDIDAPLLQSLLRRWKVRFVNATHSRRETALFNSLAMAYQAMMLPAADDLKLYDLGRLCALWVSAFEILSHPGPGGKANLETVFDLLENVPWVSSKIGIRKYKTKYRNRTAYRSLPSWLYSKVYHIRNDFLHGNNVSAGSFLIKPSGKHVFRYLAPLYRLALTSYLPLQIAKPRMSGVAQKDVDEYFRVSGLRAPQIEAEDAILSSRAVTSAP